jgi:hypothetical protein
LRQRESRISSAAREWRLGGRHRRLLVSLRRGSLLPARRLCNHRHGRSGVCKTQLDRVRPFLLRAMRPKGPTMFDRDRVYALPSPTEYGPWASATSPFSRAWRCRPNLAACRPSLPLGRDGMIGYRCARIPCLAAVGLRLLGSPAVQCGLPCCGRRAQYSARKPRAAHVARARRSRARRGHYSVRAADRSLQAEDRPGQPPAKTAARPLCHPMGQAPSHAELCPEFLRRARRVYARGATYYAAVIRHGAQTRAVMISCLDVDLG